MSDIPDRQWIWSGPSDHRTEQTADLLCNFAHCEQLQVLVDEALHLQEQYSGDDAEKIQQQQTLVIEHWASLEAHSAKHASDLQDLYNFYASVSSDKCGMVRERQYK